MLSKNKKPKLRQRGVKKMGKRQKYEESRGPKNCGIQEKHQIFQNQVKEIE